MAKVGRKKKEEIDILIEEREKIIEQDIIKLVEESKQEQVNDFVELEKEIEGKIVDEILPIETKIEMQEVLQIKNTSMSDQATKWEKYIAMYRMTPELFLEKYPYHIHRKFIEEIIEV